MRYFFNYEKQVYIPFLLTTAKSHTNIKIENATTLIDKLL